MDLVERSSQISIQILGVVNCCCKSLASCPVDDL